MANDIRTRPEKKSLSTTDIWYVGDPVGEQDYHVTELVRRLHAILSGSEGERPSEPVAGETLFFNTTTGTLEIFDGSVWRPVQSEQVDDDNAILGASWDKGSDPTLTRTHAAAGLEFNAGVDNQAVRNDFDYAPIYREIRREIIDGQTMVWIPKFYIGILDEPNRREWMVSKRQYPGFELPACFIDFVNGGELDGVYVGAFNLTEDNGVGVCRPGETHITPRSLPNFRALAQTRGAGWGIMDIHAYFALQTLIYIEFGTLDVQTIIRGHTSGRYSNDDATGQAGVDTNKIVIENADDNFVVGQSIGIGTNRDSGAVTPLRRIVDIQGDTITFDGDPVSYDVGATIGTRAWVNGACDTVASTVGGIGDLNSGKYPFVWRGIENMWGDIFQAIDGVNITGHQAWVAKDQSKYASNVFVGPDYEELGYINSDTNGWVKQVGFDPNNRYVAFPIEVGGSDVTYYADQYNRANGARVAFVGGNWRSGRYAGLAYWGLSWTSSYGYILLGARPLYKPS